MSNIFFFFFGCGPVASSFARTLIQESAGGVTQMASFVSCSVLIFVLLFVGPLFETLPYCVLSPIIVVALKGMFHQVIDAKTMWEVSRIDAMIWIATFFGVILIDIDYGLILGVVVSVGVLLARSQKPTTARLGRVPNTDLYLDVKKYSATVEIPAVVMFQFRGPLHFANSEYFRNQLVEVTGLDPFTIATSRCAILKERMLEENLNIQLTHKDPIGMVATRSLMVEETLRLTNTQIMRKTKHVSLTLPEVDWLVVEMSGVGYIDSSAGRLLSQLSKEYKKAGITLCLAAPSENVLETLEVCGTLKVIPQEHIFHSAHDAVMSISHPSTPVAAESSTQL